MQSMRFAEPYKKGKRQTVKACTAQGTKHKAAYIQATLYPLSATTATALLLSHLPLLLINESMLSGYTYMH
jgi:hypothetical protein